MNDAPARIPVIPVLLYHAVMADPPAWIAEFTVTPGDFTAHLDAVVASGRTPVPVSTLAEHLAEHPTGHVPGDVPGHVPGDRADSRAPLPRPSPSSSPSTTASPTSPVPRPRRSPPATCPPPPI